MASTRFIVDLSEDALAIVNQVEQDTGLDRDAVVSALVVAGSEAKSDKLVAILSERANQKHAADLARIAELAKKKDA